VAAIVAGSSPLMAQGLVMISFRKQPSEFTISKTKLLGFAIALTGIIGISFEKTATSRAIHLSQFYGYLLMLLAVFSKSAASVFAHKYLTKFNPLMNSWGQTVCGKSPILRSSFYYVCCSVLS